MTSWFKSTALVKPDDEVEVAHEISTKGKYGLEVCYDGDRSGVNVVADIIFVHGLTGNRQNTWTTKTDKVFWPKDLLSRTLPNTRIMTFGYDADIAHFLSAASQNRIGEHAGNLVNAVTEVREATDTEHRPIIFVTHSLGGLVTEDALLYSKNSAEAHLQDMMQSVVGICFLGTPHCGSDLANWGSVVGNLAKFIKNANVDIINVLKTDSEVLARIQRDFHTMLRGPSFEFRAPIKITCFYEELSVAGAGVIVPKHSAILSSYNAIGIHSNHMDMTKFSDTSDPGYRSVTGELRRWVKELARAAAASGPWQSGQAYGAAASRGRGYESDARNQSYRDERARYQQYEEDEDYHYGGQPRRYPYSGPNGLIPRYAESGHANLRHQPNLNAYSPHPQPPPSPLGSRNYDYIRRARSPSFQQYRDQGGYSSPPPPPPPRFIDDAEPEPAYPHPHLQPSYREHPEAFPMGTPYREYREPSPLPRPPLPAASHSAPPATGNTYHSVTHSGGTSFNGVNFNIGGNAKF